MLKLLLLSALLFLNLHADETETVSKPANHALGLTVSNGLGKGLMYRYYFNDDYFLQTAGVFGGYKEDNESNFYIDYSLSVARYLYSDSASLFHIRTIIGAEYEYSDKKNVDEGTNTFERQATVAGGFGFELGSRRSGGFLMSLDLLYAFEYEDENNFKFVPSAGASIMYNW